MKPVKIKICGLQRMEDVDYVNREKPDYVGFIVDFPKSHRSKTEEEVEILSKSIRSDIQKVGVFVDAPVEIPIRMVRKNIIDVVQLHGNEDETYIKQLRNSCKCKIIKAFIIQSIEDFQAAADSSVDYVLLDRGRGDGKSFDWSMIPQNFSKPFFLAGGLTPDNIDEAYRKVLPYALDISSGVETNGQKDGKKIHAIMAWRNEKEGSKT